MLTREDAISFLHENGCPENVIRHCTCVSSYARKLAVKIRGNGHLVDVSFVEVAGLLHDIGRCRTHDIDHGIEGANILADYPEYARVCERHIGAGLTRKEALEFGLPGKDYIPETLEEKIIAHADNLTVEDRIVTVDEAVINLRKHLGEGHPAMARVKKLAEEIEKLLD